jgi:hypothetical protein
LPLIWHYSILIALIAASNINKTLIDYRMENIKKLMRFFRNFLFAFLFAACMVMGVLPVIPKRKERFEIEIKMQKNEEEGNTKETIILYEADS